MYFPCWFLPGLPFGVLSCWGGYERPHATNLLCYCGDDGGVWDMNGLAVRNILIPFIAPLGDIRIEVSIGATRADVVCINGSLSGYEIKGDSDPVTSQRFARQIVAYDSVFDYCWLAVSGDTKTQVNAIRIIPGYWGLLSIHADRVCTLRTAAINPNQNAQELASQLWCSQLMSFLKKRGIKLSYKRKETLTEAAAQFPIDDIRAAVISEWKNRKVEPNMKWKARKVTAIAPEGE